MLQNLPLFPQQASTLSGQVDALYFYLLAITGFFSVLIFVMILVFAIKYRRSRHPKAEPIEGNNTLELVWTLIPLGLAMTIFVWGAIVYYHYSRPPANSLRVYGTGKQWMWKFQHPEGAREINSLHVPVGRPVEVTLISQDVIHSFYVPAFRVKMDVLPGRYRTTWFQATKTGTYHLFCAEYCGTQHSGMIGKIVVMEPSEYEAWITSNGEGSMGSTGEKLFRHFGCISCHRADSGARGPDLAGLAGRKVLLADGRTVPADQNYLRESILQPKAKLASGFLDIMPTFQGLMDEEEMLQLVTYIESLKEMPLNVNPEAEVPSPEQLGRHPFRPPAGKVPQPQASPKEPQRHE